jgi:Uma2 family endonuclease
VIRPLPSDKIAQMRKAAPTRPPMTIAEFLEWDAGDDRHYELIDGVPTAMAPAVPVHGRISANLARRIDEALDDRASCSVIVTAGILSPDEANTWYEADVAVSCRPIAEDGRNLERPLIIIEILSPSTEDEDRKRKLPKYRQIDSVREIVLIDSTQMYCEVHRKVEKSRWLTDLLLRPDASLRLESIDFEQPLSVIYARTGLQPEQKTASRRRTKKNK